MFKQTHSSASQNSQCGMKLRNFEKKTEKQLLVVSFLAMNQIVLIKTVVVGSRWLLGNH